MLIILNRRNHEIRNKWLITRVFWGVFTARSGIFFLRLISTFAFYEQKQKGWWLGGSVDSFQCSLGRKGTQHRHAAGRDELELWKSTQILAGDIFRLASLFPLSSIFSPAKKGTEGKKGCIVQNGTKYKTYSKKVWNSPTSESHLDHPSEWRKGK